MSRLLVLGWVVLMSKPAWPQAISGDPSQMQMMPQVTGEAYSSEVESQERSNYLSAGLYLTTAYDDNVIGLGGSKPVSDVSYMIRPSIGLNTTTTRQVLNFSCSPGFTFYQPTSTLNESDESAMAAYHYRLTPHIGVYADDVFAKSSSLFNQPDAVTGGAVSGSPQPAVVVVPYTDQIRNALVGGISDQVSLNGMIGASAVAGLQDYPNPSQTSGLYNSSYLVGSVYYSTRLSEKYYTGVRYAYGRSLTSAQNEKVQTQTNTVGPLLTLFLKRGLSISLSGGPQYVVTGQPGSPVSYKYWTPSVTVGVGWRGSHASFAASYLHTVTSGVGLLGSYSATGLNAMGHWQISPKWNAGISVNYQSQSLSVPAQIAFIQGGHTLAGGITAGRALSERIRLEFGYSRLHQSYAGIPVIDISPDSDREYVSISYQLTRPVGR